MNSNLKLKVDRVCIKFTWSGFDPKLKPCMSSFIVKKPKDVDDNKSKTILILLMKLRTTNPKNGGGIGSTGESPHREREPRWR